MRTNILVAAIALAVSPLAWSAQETKIALKDGTTVVVFEDGKMAMRTSKGAGADMAEGHQMETKDGRIVVMRGNEVQRKTEQEKELDRIYFGGP